MTDPSAWLLTASERANAGTAIDQLCDDGTAWVDGNLVTPLVHGSAYFADLHERLQATEPGDLVLFTDWQGDADERLTGEPGSEVLEVLGSADERGVDVRGLVWRSHLDQTGFFASENRHLGERLQQRGAEVLLDMRVRAGGSHHQKFVVIRHRDDPSRDVAWIGGIDLAHNRRDDAEHRGDPQSQPLADEYGDRPPWHDVQVRVQGPAVHAVETVFRERWEDPTPLSRSPLRQWADRLRRLDTSPDPLPPQSPPPPVAGSHRVQLLRTYPNLRHGRDYPFARGGERSVARGYTKAVRQARRLVYVEDQYFWGDDVAGTFLPALREHPGLRLVVVIPLFPDVEGRLSRPGRAPRAHPRPEDADRGGSRPGGGVRPGEPRRHAGLRPRQGVRDRRRVGQRRLGQLQPPLLDPRLRAVLRRPRRGLRHVAATRAGGRAPRPRSPTTPTTCATRTRCTTPTRRSAAALDAWHDGGRTGERPPGRLRTLPLVRAARLAGAAGAGPARPRARPRRSPRPAAGRDGLLRSRGRDRRAQGG